MKKESLRSKFLGSLIGTAIGDSLGASLEGLPMVDLSEIRALGEKRPALVYTDDTHMMIGVAESLIANRGFDGEHMAHCFMENYNREPFRGYGSGPPRIFRMIRGGQAWNKAAGKLYGGGSYGNGSAMRIAPVGVFFYDNPAKLKEVAYKSSQITHTHELGMEGAALQAYAVALATAAEGSAKFQADEFLAELIDFMGNEVYRQKLREIKRLLVEKENKLNIINELGHGVEALNSVPTAIYSFLSHYSSFEEAVIYAISLGGDTDTIGAMTGAISGAYLGVQSIPPKWLQKLENREYLEGLAEGLWRFRESEE
ncbi:ADP-ribosylglycohydrolase family protein [Chloroflexota bacterium]